MSGSPMRSPNTSRSPPTATSPSTKPVTGFAFTYKPDSQGDIQKSPSRTTTPLSPLGRKQPPSAASRDLQQQQITPKTTSFPSKSAAVAVTLDEKKSKQFKTSKPRSGVDITSPPSGRTSRQSKDSKLEESDNESSISSGSSSLDEYEKESYVGSIKPKPVTTTAAVGATRKPFSSTASPAPYGQTKSLTKPPVGAKSPPPPPVKPKPTSLFDYHHPQKGTPYSSAYQDGLGGPKITHASRKRVITNADGSTYETEEILEPSSLTSHSTATKTKPVVVGVVPSTQSSTTYSRPESVFANLSLTHYHILSLVHLLLFTHHSLLNTHSLWFRFRFIFPNLCVGNFTF